MSTKPQGTRPKATISTLLDRSPLGLAPLIILALTIISGLWLAMHPIETSSATLRLWTYARPHADDYNKARPAFEAQHAPATVDIQLVHGETVTSRLRAAFWADLDVPDLVEVVIDRAGSFFRGEVEDVGFMDLTPYLQSSGMYDRVVQSRFAPYSNRGKIFGLPHDVHPVMLAYRRDLFEELGIDPDTLVTWDDFIAAGQRITIRTGANPRYMIDLDSASSSSIEVLLFQRGGGYFDSRGNLIINQPITVRTLKWFVPLVAGPNRIATGIGWGASFAQGVEDGYVLSFICPDWRTKITENDIPRVSGKMALMPLPMFNEDPNRRRTSTWGGTMLGITKACKDKDLAWALATHLYLNPQDLAARFTDTNIIPPFKEAWDQPAFNEPRQFWSDQPIGRLYADLAQQVPPQYTSPFIELAKGKLGQVVSACARYYNDHGNDENFDDKAFEAFITNELELASNYIQTQMSRDPFR